ncbi:MAG TPA: beta-propeller fold lactonase family protein [Candidatus Limnocylindria bacterium]|nr:beta-propeller fold lactonase family protein [Candidatus Limnocylindria bacterium]
MKGLAVVVTSALVLASCASGSAVPAVPAVPTIAAVEPVASSAPTPSPTPTPRLYSKLRVFVASESTDQVWALEATGSGQFEPIAKIPVGRLPHQMAVSPDGKYVAVNNRMAASTSIIDPLTLKEVVRIPVGKQPHGITFSPDSRTLFVAHERDHYIMSIEVGTWKTTPLMVGVPQHVLTISADRPNELWFTVTNSSELDHLRVYDLTSKKSARIAVADVHDAYFTPDGSELWTSSSGFLDKPSDRMVIYDPVARKVKQEIRLPGRYPFHTLKPMQDGMFRLPQSGLMVLADHIGPALIWVDWRERRVVSETKLGQQPFHSTYDPEGQRILVTTNVDGMVNVIDLATRQVVQKIPVTKAHGIVSVGVP